MKNSEIQFLAEESERTLLTLRQHIKDLPQTFYEVVDLPAWADEYPLGTAGAAFFVGLEGAQLLRGHQCQQASGTGKEGKPHQKHSFLSTLSSLSTILPRVESISQTALSFVTGLLGASAIGPQP